MNRLPGPLIERIQSERRSKSIAEVAVALSVTKNTVIKYGRGVEREPCGCGKPGGHKGWCAVMLAKSPRRRAVVASFVPPNRKWTEAARTLLVREWEAGTDRVVIATMVDAMLGTSGTTPHAVMVAAGKLKARRPAGYLSRVRREGRLHHFHGSNTAKWAEAIARAEARQVRPRYPRLQVDRDLAATLWADRFLSVRDLRQQTGLTYQTLRNWFGPRTGVARDSRRSSPSVQAAAVEVPAQVQAPAQPVAMPAPARPRGFSMLAMRGPDPLAAARLRQAQEAGRGRLTPQMRSP